MSFIKIIFKTIKSRPPGLNSKNISEYKFRIYISEYKLVFLNINTKMIIFIFYTFNCLPLFDRLVNFSKFFCSTVLHFILVKDEIICDTQKHKF